MNAELLYTSAPQGLKQGSRGFCTVQSTVGMPINLAMKLESLSGYRHLYLPGDPKAPNNPVAFSHIRFSVGGRSVSVLSRIADYGLDYSQRTNKLAHHVVLEPPLPAAGPVQLIQQPGFLKTSWDGKCTTLPPPMLPSVATPIAGICKTWQKLLGDAGWGGVVAQHWMQPRAKPLHIIFSESQSSLLLNLLAESIALLPPSMLWEATFSTYVTSLPPDIDCKVRCLISGSDEARSIAARQTVIDLTKVAPSPPPGKAIDAARSGRRLESEGSSTRPMASDPLQREPHRNATPEVEDEFFDLLNDSVLEVTTSPDAPPPVLAPAIPKPQITKSVGLASEERSNVDKPRGNATAVKSLAILVALLALVVLGLAISMVGKIRLASEVAKARNLALEKKQIEDTGAKDEQIKKPGPPMPGPPMPGPPEAGPPEPGPPEAGPPEAGPP